LQSLSLFRTRALLLTECPLNRSPQVQASIAANTYVVSGHAENKKLQDLLPGIINQLGPDNLANLKKLAETYQSGAAPPPAAGADDDEDVPDLVDNFEEASK
jgi:nascent polypeptide-associated complex subunit beta